MLRKRFCAVLLTMTFLLSSGGCSMLGKQQERQQPAVSSMPSEVQGSEPAVSSEPSERQSGSPVVPEANLPDGLTGNPDFDSYTEIFNAYVQAYNIMNGRLQDSLNRYYDSVGYQKEFMIPESEYSCYSISVSEAEKIEELYRLINTKSEKDKLDKAFERLYPSLMALIDCLNDIFDYTNQKMYLEDDYVKGREYHEVLWSAENQYWMDQRAFDREFQKISQERKNVELQFYKDDGQEMMYTVNLLIFSAQSIQTELYNQRIEDENLLDMDLPAIEPLYEEFSDHVAKVRELAKDEAKLDEEGFPYDHYSWDSFLRYMSYTKVTLTEILQRVKDRKPFEENEKNASAIGVSNLFTFHKDVTGMIDAYNDMRT